VARERGAGEGDQVVRQPVAAVQARAGRMEADVRDLLPGL